MTTLRYSVAQSLDGFIGGPNGEYDWIPEDPDIDFVAMYAKFSGLVMGRRSYEVYVATGGAPGPALPVWVCSRSLPEGTRDNVTIVRDGVAAVRRLKQEDRPKPLWLWGGAELFREMAAAGLVDGVDVAVIPVVLGSGLPLIAPPVPRLPLTLRAHRLYPRTGIVMLEYDVIPGYAGGA